MGPTANPSSLSGYIACMKGTVISERYEVLDTLGQGGMGIVLKCHDTLLQRFVAVKVLATSTAGTAVKRFQLEARAAARLKQANILQVHDFGETKDGRLYLVMDFVDGMTLGDLLKERKFLPVEEAIPLFLQICKGIAHAHGQGVLHRDIKPSNVMLSNSDDENWVKIVDFGIAKLNSEDQRLTSTGALIGSPLYMAPEATLNKEVDTRSDIYSIGCLMFETLAGTPPYQGETSMATVMMHTTEPIPSLKVRSTRTFPAQVETTVASCLAKDPLERYQSIDELLTDLEDIERTLQEEAEKNEHRKKEVQKSDFVKSATSNKKPNLAVAAIGLLAIGIGVFASMNMARIPLVSETSPDNHTEGRKKEVQPFEKFAEHGDNHKDILANPPVANSIVEEVSPEGYHSAKASFTTDDDQVINQFEQLKNIENWRLSDSQIGLKAIEKIAEAPVKYLELKNTAVDDKCMEVIGTMKELRGLQLGCCMRINPTGYEPLKKNKHLATLQVSLPEEPGKAMKVLDTLTTLKHLTYIDVRGTMNGAMIRRIPSFKHLDRIQLETPTADGWEEMKRLGHLKFITLVINSKDQIAQERVDQLKRQIKSTVLTKAARRGPGTFDDGFDEELEKDIKAKKQIPFF